MKIGTKARWKRAFTLVEMLVVIGILSALAIRVFISTKPTKRLTDAKTAVVNTNLGSIKKAVNMGLLETPSAFSSGTCAAGALPSVPTVMKSSGGYDIAPCLAKYFTKMPYNPNAGFYTSNSNYDTGYTIAYDPVTYTLSINPVQYFYTSQFGTVGCASNGQFTGPNGVAVSRSIGSIYVADNCHQLQGFNSSLVALFNKIGATPGGTTGTGTGQFNAPHGIAIAANGDVYVADTQNHRVQYFTSAGVYKGKFGTGTPGNTSTTLNTPFDVAVSPVNGNIYVGDSANNRVLIFNPVTPTGTFVNAFSVGSFIYGLTVAANGDVYIPDPTAHRVKVFTAASNYLSVTQFPTAGDPAGGTELVYDIEIAPNGDIYVTDDSSNRVEVFNSAKVYQTSFGSTGSGNGQFNGLEYISVGSDGKIYVSDYTNNRIQVFTP